VLSTNGAGGTYAIVLYPGELPIAETPVSTAVVGSGRTITATSPLTGGGDLSADRSLGCQTASSSQGGCLSAADWTTFNNKGTAITFQSAAANASSGQCIATNGYDGHATCPSTAGFPTDVVYTYGPMPASTTISVLEVQIDANAAGSGNTVSVLDNGSSILSCTVTSGNSTCSNGGSATVTQGDYLQVQVTNNAGASNRKYRVAFH
jgi:hypothetical protein